MQSDIFFAEKPGVLKVMSLDIILEPSEPLKARAAQKSGSARSERTGLFGKTQWWSTLVDQSTLICSKDPQFSWWCRDGIIANIEKALQRALSYHGLLSLHLLWILARLFTCYCHCLNRIPWKSSLSLNAATCSWTGRCRVLQMAEFTAHQDGHWLNFPSCSYMTLPIHHCHWPRLKKNLVPV